MADTWIGRHSRDWVMDSFKCPECGAYNVDMISPDVVECVNPYCEGWIEIQGVDNG
jgi:hypothetical protein